MASNYRSLLGFSEGARKIHVHETVIESTADHSSYEHTHTAEEAVYLLEGEAKYTFAGQTHHAKPGQLVFFPSDVAHAEIEYLTPKLRYLVIRSVEPDDEPCCCGQDRPEEN